MSLASTPSETPMNIPSTSPSALGLPEVTQAHEREKILSLIQHGKIEEVLKMMKGLSAAGFAEVHKKGERGYTQIGRHPHPLVEELVDTVTKAKKSINLVELGPGVGNDATYILKTGMVDHYRGIEFVDAAARKARASVKQAAKETYDDASVASVYSADYQHWLHTLLAGAKNNQDFPTHVLAISAVHALGTRRDVEQVLTTIKEVLIPQEGHLYISTKTPASSSFRNPDNRIISPDTTYPLVYNMQEGMVRAFPDRPVFLEMIQDSGFDIIRKKTHKVIGYDNSEDREEFTSVVAKPRRD